MKKIILLIIISSFFSNIYSQKYVKFKENVTLTLEPSLVFTINKGEIFLESGDSIVFFEKKLPVSSFEDKITTYTLPDSSAYKTIQKIIEENPLSISISITGTPQLYINAKKLEEALNTSFKPKNLKITFYSIHPFNEREKNGAELVKDMEFRQPLENYANKYIRYAIIIDNKDYPDQFIAPALFNVITPTQNAQEQPLPAGTPAGAKQQNPDTPSPSSKEGRDYPIDLYIILLFEVITLAIILRKLHVIPSGKQKPKPASSSDSKYNEILKNIQKHLNTLKQDKHLLNEDQKKALEDIFKQISLMIDKNGHFPWNTNSRKALKNLKSQLSSPLFQENNKSQPLNGNIQETLKQISLQLSSLPLEENTSSLSAGGSGEILPTTQSQASLTEENLKKILTAFRQELENKEQPLKQEIQNLLSPLPSKEDIGQPAQVSQLENIQQTLQTINTILTEKNDHTELSIEKAQLTQEKEKLSKENTTLQNDLRNKEQRLLYLEEKVSNIPAGIIYLGNCQRIIDPYLNLLSYMAECEKEIIDIIQNAPQEDARTLKLLLAKFAIAKPETALMEWKSILSNLQINGMIVHPIKNAIEKEITSENKIKIVKQKIFEQLFRPYLSTLLILTEEMRTANEYIGLKQKITINFKDCITKILSDARALDYDIIYFPMLQQIQGNDYSKIESRENPEIIKQYPVLGQWPAETIIAIEKYAVNLDNSVPEKTILTIK